MATALSIITIIGPIILALLHMWQQSQPARTQEEKDNATMQGRNDIAIGNAAAVTERIDRVLTVQADTAPGSPTGEHDTGDLLQQFAREEGVEILPDRAGSAGEAPGESGSVQGEVAVKIPQMGKYPN